jgi:hypothetical protein
MTVTFAHVESAGAELIGSNLRSTLFALAADPRALRSPERALGALRVIVDIVRGESDLAAPAEEAHSARGRLTDAAVVGLLRFARAALGRQAESMIAPVSCVAIGDYASAASNTPFAGGLLVLLEERRVSQARGTAIAGFMVRGLADLGFDIETYAKTVDEASLPAFARWQRQHRLIAGQQALFARFQRRAGEIESIRAVT